jgi:hypothetical protein
MKMGVHQQFDVTISLAVVPGARQLSGRTEAGQGLWEWGTLFIKVPDRGHLRFRLKLDESDGRALSRQAFCQKALIIRN